MRMLLLPSLTFVAWAEASAKTNPTFAFTYTTPKQDWSSYITAYDAVFVYAGDVEFYCRGMPTATSGGGASPATLPCKFTGDNPNAFVYYNDFAKTAAAKFKASGKTVYINFDGRISPKDEAFVPNFSSLSTAETEAFAATVAAHVCTDPNVDGMAWDVEPFNNDQTDFFAQLDTHISACGKTFGVFAFGETFDADMWSRGLGKSGYLFDSTYDLDCSKTSLPPLGCRPCQCTPPDIYKTVLPSHLAAVMQLSKQYQKPYRLMVSGSGSTQIYENLTTSYCAFGGGGATLDSSCPYTMSDWMTMAMDVFDAAGVRNDPRFLGVGVYGYTSTNGGGFSPTTPPSATLKVLEAHGYLPNAAPTNNDSHMGAVKIYNQTVGLPHYMVGSPKALSHKNRCLSDSSRPIGCKCTRSWLCDSNWCENLMCLEHP